MDGIIIGIFVLVGLFSFGMSAYFTHRNYAYSRDFLKRNIEQAEEDLRNDIHRITLEELMQTHSGKELLTLLTNAEKSEWNNPDYRKAALEMAKEQESLTRQKGNNLHFGL